MSEQEIIDKAYTCPFCGGKVSYGKNYWPATIELYCDNPNCYITPNLTLEVYCKPNPDGKTFEPQFDSGHHELLVKWNTRNG